MQLNIILCIKITFWFKFSTQVTRLLLLIGLGTILQGTVMSLCAFYGTMLAYACVYMSYFSMQTCMLFWV